MGQDYFNKTEDQLEVNTLLALISSRKWNFSSSFNLKTQNAPQGITLLKQMEVLNGLKPLVFLSCLHAFGIGIFL